MHHRFKIKKGIDEETKKNNFKIFMEQCNMTMADNESIENNIIYNETQLYLLGHKIFIMILKIVMLFAIIWNIKNFY